jgi:hypothetical protein
MVAINNAWFSSTLAHPKSLRHQPNTAEFRSAVVDTRERLRRFRHNARGVMGSLLGDRARVGGDHLLTLLCDIFMRRNRRREEAIQNSLGAASLLAEQNARPFRAQSPSAARH